MFWSFFCLFQIDETCSKHTHTHTSRRTFSSGAFPAEAQKELPLYCFMFKGLRTRGLTFTHKHSRTHTHTLLSNSVHSKDKRDASFSSLSATENGGSPPNKGVRGKRLVVGVKRFQKPCPPPRRNASYDIILAQEKQTMTNN